MYIFLNIRVFNTFQLSLVKLRRSNQKLNRIGSGRTWNPTRTFTKYYVGSGSIYSHMHSARLVTMQRQLGSYGELQSNVIVCVDIRSEYVYKIHDAI